MSDKELIEILTRRGVVTTDVANRDECCGQPRDEYGFCTYRPEHPIYVDLDVPTSSVEATDADRDKASRLLDLAPMGGTQALLDAIATALASEREQSAAVLRRVRSVVESLDNQAAVHEAHGLVTAHRPIAQRLRRALDGTA